MADDKVGLHKGYEHWVSPAPLNEDWDKDLEFVLIRTLDDLRVHDVEHKFVAWDTETSGLNPEMDWIVGFSFSFDGKTGYYVPVKHDDIALGKEALDIFYSILKKAGTQLLYNCRFDQRFMEYAGYNLEGLPYYDAMNAIWLADTNMVLPSLKGSERHYMGWTPKTFSETLGDATTFQHVPAEDAYKYACLDENTLLLTDHGEKRIFDIVVGNFVDTSEGFKEVVATYDNGDRETLEVSFGNDKLVCTSDHRIAVDTVVGPAYIRADELLPCSHAFHGNGSIRELTSTRSVSSKVFQDFSLMFYLLGLAWSDGWMNHEKNALSFHFSINDQEFFEVLAKTFGNASVRTRKDLSKTPSGNFCRACDLTLTSIHIKEFFIRHGYVCNKSDRVYKDIPDQYFSDFLRGLYDGDGSSNHHTMSFMCHTPIKEQLIDDIQRLYGVCPTKSYYRNNVWSLSYGHSSSFVLWQVMYSTGSLFIRRKRDKAICGKSRFVRVKDVLGVERVFNSISEAARFYCVASSSLSHVATGSRSTHKGLVATYETDLFSLLNTPSPSCEVCSAGVRRVYDIQVKDVHNFRLANGIISHNCTDAIGTYKIAMISNRYYVENKPASKYDNDMLYPLMRLENTPQRLDTEYLLSLRPQVDETIERTKAEVYRLAGQEFNLNSPQQFGKILVERFAVDTGARTATGAMKADLKTVDAWLTKHSATVAQDVKDFLKAYKEYKKTVKFKSAYLEKYIKAAQEQDKFPVRFSYKVQSVPTGRLSCGADAKNSFFTKNNVQCLEENTEVLTSEGIKPIKDIVTGELVWSGSAFVPCVQLGSKQKRCETIWTYFGKITASLEHKFYTLNLVTFELEWECLGNAISCGKPLVRNTNDGGFTFRELLENEMFKKSMLLKPELSEERIKELEEIYEDVRFDMIRKADNFWYPNIIPPEVTVYDLCVPTYERFTANGFIVHNSTPKPHAIMLKGRKATEQEIAEKKDILGWYFSNDIPDEEAKGLVEGMEPGNLNIRRAFLPENDQCYVVSIDMAAEELRIVANLCHEDTWIHAFNSGADVHKACYSPDTEFMTERGWLTADEITPDMKIAYYDDKTDSVKFTRADKRCTNDATEVYSREGTFDVTDNHRMYVRCANEESYGIVLAKDLKSKGNPRQKFAMKVSMGNPIDFGYVMKSILDPIFFMSGFVIASKHEIKDDRIHITLCHPCLSMPYSVLSMVDGSNIRTTSLTLTKEATHRLSVNGFLRSSETLLSHVVEMLSQDSGTVKKDFTQQMVCGLVYGLASREDSELHIGNGDGIHGRVYIEDKSLADVIQWALTLNGISCQCVYGIHKKKYVLHVKTLKDNAIGMSYHSVKKQNVAGKNLVYSCFTVPSGLLVTRYHGRITVNGNTAIKLFGEENYSKDARKKAKCVAGDTILHTADGHTIAIRDLVSAETRKNAVIGEPVELPEPKTRISTPEGWSPVTHWISNGKKDTLKLIIERQLTLEVTPDHLVGKYDPEASDDLSKKYRLVRADSLSVGHYVLWDYCPMRITDIQKGSSDVYDITVDNASHTFHANGVVVHNCASFGILYGSGAQGFNNSFPDMTLDECREFMTKFKAALPNITSGQQAYVEHAKIYGCVPTAFGRMRRVRWFLQSGDRAKVAFGERTVKNCYSPDTEFLTKDGWKLAKDILPDTQLAYYVPEKKVIRYTNAGERYTHRCTESVVYHSVSGAWNVTTNHRMWVSKNGNDFESVVADKLCDMDKFTVITSSFMDDENSKHKHDETAFTIDGKSFTFEDMAFLLGVCIRRGVITYKRCGGSRDGVLTVACDVSQTPVMDRLKRTFGTLLKETKRLQAGKYLKMFRFDVSLRDYVKENIGKTRKAFHVPAWISDADTLTVEAFIAGVVGQKMIEHPNELFTFRTHDKKLADDIQRLCTMCGFFTRLMSNKDANGKNAFTMHIQRMNLRIIGNYKRDEYRQRPVHKVTHEEMEYSCFEVPSHILVTRYRGFVSYHMNTTVQGTAADVLKLIFCRLWKKVFKPYPQVKFMSTIHDEVNFSIPIELAREVIPICMECMTINRSDWPVTLKCSLSVSRTDLGSLVPFTYDFEHDTYEPEWDTLDVKPKKKEEPKLVAAVPDETKQDEAEMELHFEFLTDEDMLF